VTLPPPADAEAVGVEPPERADDDDDEVPPPVAPDDELEELDDADDELPPPDDCVEPPPVPVATPPPVEEPEGAAAELGGAPEEPVSSDGAPSPLGTPEPGAPERSPDRDEPGVPMPRLKEASTAACSTLLPTDGTLSPLRT